MWPARSLISGDILVQVFRGTVLPNISFQLLPLLRISSPSPCNHKLILKCVLERYGRARVFAVPSFRTNVPGAAFPGVVVVFRHIFGVFGKGFPWSGFGPMVFLRRVLSGRLSAWFGCPSFQATKVAQCGWDFGWLCVAARFGDLALAGFCWFFVPAPGFRSCAGHYEWPDHNTTGIL